MKYFMISVLAAAILIGFGGVSLADEKSRAQPAEQQAEEQAEAKQKDEQKEEKKSEQKEEKQDKTEGEKK